MDKRFSNRDEADLPYVFAFLPGLWAVFTTRELRLEAASESLLEIAGRDLPLIGDSLTDLLPNLSHHSLFKDLLPVWDSGVTHISKNYRFDFQLKDERKTVHLDLLLKPVRNLHGEVYAILFSATDTDESNRPVSEAAVEADQGLLNVRDGISEITFAELRAAKAESDKKRDQMNSLFMDTLACICILSGPELIYELVNSSYQQLFPGRQLLGKSIFDALPEIAGLPIEDIFRNVYKTGETYLGKEFGIGLLRTTGGPVEDCYFNFVFQARRDEKQQIDGIIVFALEVTDLVLTKIEVEQHASRLSALVMSAHFGLVILRGENYVVEVANKQIQELWERSSQEVVGRPLLDILPEIADQPFPALLRQVYETGLPYGGKEEVFYAHTASGLKTKYVSFYYDPMLDPLGQVSGIIVSAHEITSNVQNRLLLEKSLVAQEFQVEELRCINTQLLESEMRFRSSIEEAPVAIAVLKGKELILESANEMMLKLMGRDAVIVDQPLLQVLPELQNQEFGKLLLQTYTEGRLFSGTEQKVLLKDDQGILQTGYLNYIFKPLFDDRGNISSVMVVATEVSEQVNARAELQKTVETLKLSIEASDVGVWSYDIKSAFISTSARQKALFGFQEGDEVTGASLLLQVSEDQRTLLRQTIIDSIKSGEPLDIIFATTGFHDHKLRWIRSLGSLILDDAGNPSYYSGVSIETTRQVEDEQRKNQFINIVSHELKTPLTSLKGYIQILQQSTPEKEDLFRSSLLAKADARVIKMTNLINGFLNVTLLESGKIQLNTERFDLVPLISEMIEDINLQKKVGNIHFKLSVPAFVEADRDKIGQVISNLLSNAIKYSPAGSPIEISCLPGDESVTVSVQDAGVGISRKDQDQVFDRYYRVDSPQNKHISGFGIGLYLCKEIIAEHKGTVSVESEFGRGSAFSFSLPQ